MSLSRPHRHSYVQCLMPIIIAGQQGIRPPCISVREGPPQETGLPQLKKSRIFFHEPAMIEQYSGGSNKRDGGPESIQARDLTAITVHPCQGPATPFDHALRGYYAPLAVGRR